MDVTAINMCLYIYDLEGSKRPAPLRDALSRGGKCMCGPVLLLHNVKFFHLKKEKCLEQLVQQNSFISPILLTRLWEAQARLWEVQVWPWQAQAGTLEAQARTLKA